MLKVLIVDDEVLIRDEIKSLIDWISEEFTIVGEASNGMIALNMFTDLQPDVVLLDIRMPVMDGLSFMEQLNNKGYKAKVIILSSFEDFGFAQKAIRLGAFDYLLKHLMDNGNLLEALRKARKEIQRELEAEARMKSLVERLEVVLPVGKQAFFRNLLETDMDSDSEDFASEFDRLGMELKEGSYHLFVFAIDDFTRWFRHKDPKEANVLKLNFIKTMQQVIRRYGNGEVFVQSESTYCILLNGVRYISELEIKKVLRKVANDIAHEIKLCGQITLSVVIVPRIGSIRQVRSYFLRASELLRVRIFTGYGKIYFLDELDYILRKCSKEDIHKTLELVMEALEACDIEKLKDCLNKAFMQILSGTCDLESLDEMVNGLVKIYEESVTRHHLDKELYIEQQVTELDSLGRLHEFFIEHFSALIQEVLEFDIYGSSIVKQAVNYIKKHYNEDINLNIVANHVSVNKVYLSILFKKVTGENFLDFVTRTRIDKARELLGKNIKLYEVACMVGFNDPKYFSVVFKKVVGLSPFDYRKSKAL